MNVLDAGAGDGYFARRLLEDLPRGSQIVCYDPNYADHDLRTYGQSAPEGVTFSQELPEGRFDIIVLLDVIEHVPDDSELLRRMTERNLAPEGTVVVSVPAWQALYSSHDAALRHYRRYSPTQLRRVLQEQGFELVREGGAFHFLLAPRALTVAVERLLRWLGKERQAHFAEWNFGPVITSAVDALLALDNALTGVARRPLPGLSTWAVCRSRKTAPSEKGAQRIEAV